jgi:flagellar biogenesis protein FliO
VNGAASIPAAPDMIGPALRMAGALALVIGLFLTGVWVFKNWQRFAFRRGTLPKLNVLEVKSLGPRQAIYVIGYEQQRMLLASSPAGIALLSHLPEEEHQEKTAPVTRLSFAEAFQQVLARKQS